MLLGCKQSFPPSSVKFLLKIIKKLNLTCNAMLLHLIIINLNIQMLYLCLQCNNCNKRWVSFKKEKIVPTDHKFYTCKIIR